MVTLGLLLTASPAIVTGIIFAVLYHNLPRTPVEWKDAAFGGLIALLLFETGKHLFLLDHRPGGPEGRHLRSRGVCRRTADLGVLRRSYIPVRCGPGPGVRGAAPPVSGAPGERGYYQPRGD